MSDIAKLLERLEHGDTRKCPFPDLNIGPETPCPVCGDLGTLDAPGPVMCVDSGQRLLMLEAASTIRALSTEGTQ